jgi:threonine dehydrogenase-like Zn-dependent dehydrogenase
MKALVWHGKEDVRIDTVPDPKIQEPRDAIIKITSTAICGSDLHLYDGFMPAMQSGDILGHEFMGEVVEVGGLAAGSLKKGDRVVIPFTLACGGCYFCKKTLYSCCDTSNPAKSKKLAEAAMGHSPSGLFGYSHMLGGFPGGQAEYVRVPYADFGAFKVPDSLSDEQVLFLTDILPTGWMGAENAGIEPGDTVAVWGCGPVGLFAMKSAWLQGAGRVIAIDTVPERLRMAETHCRAETIDFMKHTVYDKLQEMTAGRGPDRCIDAVGAESHGMAGVVAAIDAVKAALWMGTDRPNALRQAIMCCRKGGTVSVPGVYVGFIDKFPGGAFVNKSLTMRSGQTHVHRYLRPLLTRIEKGEIDTTFLITHRLPLADAPKAYKTFRDKKDGCVKVVLKP